MSDIKLTFKAATEPFEFEQILKLNYETFVEEIPQHRAGTQRSLVDQFHKENTYLICLKDAEVIGMLAVRAKRPFSLDKKLPNLDSYLPKGRHVCEVRLLAVKRVHRNTRVFRGLMELCAGWCRKYGYDTALISGTVRQQKLYQHMGFVPFGPIVGTPEASYQPMYLTAEAFVKTEQELKDPHGSPLVRSAVKLLPGPVEIEPDVHRALGELTISHRSREFMEMHAKTRDLLCRLVNAKYVEIFVGSGTLANDVVAGQLSLRNWHGLVLSNGEFGERLIDHARRFRLAHEDLSLDWGTPFATDDIRKRLDARPDTKWLWAVHCETSTGILNNIDALKRLCAERDIRLCLDCISSIGATQVDLTDVHLASGVSGKCLGSFPGLSMVFYNRKPLPKGTTLPRYLDLSVYAEKGGVPYTCSSNLVHALYTSLKDFELEKKIRQIAALSNWLRDALCQVGLDIPAPAEHAFPAVITVRLPRHLNSVTVGQELARRGFVLSCNSEYLIERNWVQVCLMGDISREMLEPFVAAFREVTAA